MVNIKNEAPWALYGENTIAFADLEALVKFLCGGKGKDREDGVWKSEKTRTFEASNLGVFGCDDRFLFGLAFSKP